MAEYTVEEVRSRREWTPAGETQPKKVYYDLSLNGVDKSVNLGRNPGAPEIKQGDKLDLTLTDNGKDYKATEARKPGGGGFGRGGYDPRQEPGVNARKAVDKAFDWCLAQEGLKSADALKLANAVYEFLRAKTEGAS